MSKLTLKSGSPPVGSSCRSWAVSGSCEALCSHRSCLLRKSHRALAVHIVDAKLTEWSCVWELGFPAVIPALGTGYRAPALGGVLRGQGQLCPPPCLPGQGRLRKGVHARPTLRCRCLGDPAGVEEDCLGRSPQGKSWRWESGRRQGSPADVCFRSSRPIWLERWLLGR